MKRRISILFAIVWGLSPLSTMSSEGKPKSSPEGLKRVSETELELRGIRIRSDLREIRVPCRVNMTDGQIEYALVHEAGKTHESILKTAVSPADLQVALLLCHFEPATEGIYPEGVPEGARTIPVTQPKEPGAQRLAATLEWKTEGQSRKAPLSSWIRDHTRGAPPPDLNDWIFNGSVIDARGFVAEADGSILSVWVDPEAMLNSPARGNLDDERWRCQTSAIPPEDTPVTLILHPSKSSP